MSKLMTVALSRADRDRRLRVKAYQLYLASLLAEAKTHEELVALLAKLKTSEARNRTIVLGIATDHNQKQEIKNVHMSD